MVGKEIEVLNYRIVGMKVEETEFIIFNLKF